ncbi:MAG: tetratricopeptide repeat protein [Polyangiaceae bacterium]
MSRSRALFQRGRAAADANHWAEACPYFQEAHDLNATNGTAFQLARCYDAIGRTDEAKQHYQYVLDHSDRDTVNERVERARRRVREIDATAASKRTSTPAAAAALRARTLPPATSASVASEQGDSRAPSYAAFGIGGAGLAVGSVLGILALSKAGDVRDACARDGDDFRLEEGSPCQDMASPSSRLAVDLDGLPRDRMPDMGAYEVQ